MRKTTYFTTAAGVLLFIVLIVNEGVSNVAATLSVAGWKVVWIALFRIVPIAFDAFGWSILFSKEKHPSRIILLWARWIGESINTLLPVAQVGGDFVRARIVTRHGTSGIEAGATVVVDFTIGLATQVIFAFMGTAMLLQERGNSKEAEMLLLGLTIGVVLLLLFYQTQRFGLFSYSMRFLKKLVQGREMLSITGGVANLDIRISEIYNNRTDLIVCSIWKLLSWIIKTGESWLALYLLGFPVTLYEALIIESLSYAVRSAAFLIPGALGAQEGGILLIGGLVGLSPEVALALALIKRARELLTGVPGIISWSFVKARE